MGDVEVDEGKDRHFFRGLFKFALFAGMVTYVARLVAAKKKEYTGLTVSEARAKFEAKLGPRLGEETAAEIAEAVVTKLRDRGIVVDDPIAETVDEVVEHLHESADDLEKGVSEAADVFKDQAADAVDKLKDS